MSSGVPQATISPPPSPPSGPRSMIQSAVLMTSRLCSITTTVLPWSASSCSTSSSLRVSSKCRPVVGSSRMYRVRPVPRRDATKQKKNQKTDQNKAKTHPKQKHQQDTEQQHNQEQHNHNHNRHVKN